MTINNIERAPLVTDHARWRRVVIQNPTSVTSGAWTIRRSRCRESIRPTITPTRAGSARAKHQAAGEDRLILDGNLTAGCTWRPRSSTGAVSLVNRGFN
jgi:hypothetical protein